MNKQQLRKSIREFAEGEIAPHVMEWDEASHFRSKIMPKLAEMGLLGIIFPEQYGGAGLGYIEYVIAIEELSRVDGSVGIIVAAHNSLCSNHIYKFGTEAQKQKYLVPLAQGKKIGAWSLTEPKRLRRRRYAHHGPAATAITTSSTAQKLSPPTDITADTCVAMAVTDKSKASHGISAFISKKACTASVLEKKKTNSASEPAIRPKLYSPTAAFLSPIFWAPKAKGFYRQPRHSRRRPHLHCRARSRHGAGRARRRHKIREATQAVRQTISEFQAIQFKLADMATRSKPRGCSFTKPPGTQNRNSARFTRESSMAKLFASEVAVRVANECVQIHGGYGFIKGLSRRKVLSRRQTLHHRRRHQ